MAEDSGVVEAEEEVHREVGFVHPRGEVAKNDWDANADNFVPVPIVCQFVNHGNEVVVLVAASRDRRHGAVGDACRWYGHATLHVLVVGPQIDRLRSAAVEADFARRTQRRHVPFI